MKHSTKPPTKAEGERIQKMLKLGCVCCMVTEYWVQPECHHIVEGDRRLGHLWTLPICPGHHRGAWSTAQLAHYAECQLPLPPSISSGSKAFERQYGTQKELYRKLQARLELPFTWPASKIVPRRVA